MWNWTGPDSNSPAPPGVVPNYDNPIDVAWTRNVAIMVVCDVLVTLFFLVRIYIKVHINTRILADDYTCCAAYVLIILYTVAVFMSTSLPIWHLQTKADYGSVAHYGEGYDSWEIRTPQYYNLLKWLYANTVVYCPAAYFTKVTILLLMARVFAVEEKLSKGIYTFIWALLIAYIPIQVVKTVVCTPIDSLWDPTVHHVHCVDQRKVFFGDVALALLTDTIILLVPIVPTWKLHMPLRKKIKIVALLGAGGVATAITMFRTYEVDRFVNSNNLTVDYVDIDILTCLELTIGFVCACLPSLNILIERQQSRRQSQSRQRIATYWPRVKSSLRRDRTRTTQPNMRSNPTASAFDASSPVANFDTELAMFTGQPLPGADESEELDVEGFPPARLCTINSSEGLQEGWLSQVQEAKGLWHDAEHIMRMVQRARMLSEEGPEEDRCPVWDGPREHKDTECTSSRFYLLGKSGHI